VSLAKIIGENQNMSAERLHAKRWYVSGTVQGVGFRYFVRNQAQMLRLTGYAKNLADGRVEVLAVGSSESLNDLASALHKGPHLSDVRSVEELEAAAERYSEFQVR
jgi:acylphosphatase